MFRADGLVSAFEKIVDFTFTEGSREEIQTTVGEFTIPSFFKTKRSGLFFDMSLPVPDSLCSFMRQVHAFNSL